MKKTLPTASSYLPLILLSVSTAAHADLLSAMQARVAIGQSAQAKEQNIQATANADGTRLSQLAEKHADELGKKAKSDADAAQKSALLAVIKCKLKTAEMTDAMEFSFDPGKPSLAPLSALFPSDAKRADMMLWIFGAIAELQYKVIQGDSLDGHG